MAGPTRYSMLSYGAMVACEPRMSAYAEALRQAITPGCTVIDIGAGPGVFSLLACQYGAGSVIAVEPDESIQLLRKMAADNGCQDRITVIQGLSTEFEPSAKADVIVSDIRGCMPYFEAHIPTIVDARERLLAPGGKLIPARDRLRIGLVESAEDHADYEVPWTRNAFGLDLSEGRRFAANSWCKVKLGTDALLCDPVDLVELDYYRISEPDLVSSAELEVTRAGTAHGLLVWFDSELAPGIGFSNAPGKPPQIYGQTFMPLESPLDLEPGNRAEVEVTASLVEGSYVWGWNSRFHRAGSDTSFASFRQSSFLSKVMSSQSLKLHSSAYVPALSDLAQADLFCLSLLDGKRSLGVIAGELQARFPAQFPNAAAALNHAANLTGRYR